MFKLIALSSLMLLSHRQEAITLVDPGQVFADPRLVSLARAVAEGNDSEVRRLLLTGVDAKATGAKGLTLPHFALYAKSNGPAVLRLLLKAGADPISRLQGGQDLPHYAATRDDADPEFLAVLLDAGVSPDLVGGEADNSLLDAAVSGHNSSVVQLLLSRGADVNYTDPFLGTALHTALTIADYRIATLLVNSGADLALRDSQDTRIEPSVPRRTAAEVYCHSQSGQHDPASPEQLADFEEMRAAFAKHGVIFPCGI